MAYNKMDNVTRSMVSSGGVATALLAGLLAGLSLPAPAEPQVAVPPDTAVEVEDLIVTAHRLALPRDAITGTATVLSREEIERSGARSVGDLLRQVPGLSVVRSGSWGQPVSLFVRGGESDHVKVLVDGVPLNQPGGSVDLSTLTTDNVERVEVVRGPASVLYGSDAVSGVVQVFTRDGRGPPRLAAGARGGTHGSLDWDASARGGGEATAWSVSLSRFATDGLRAFNNDFDNTVASVRFRATPDRRTDASVSLRYTDHTAHTPTDGAGRAVDDNQFAFGDRLTVGTEIGRYLTDRLEARIQLRLNEIDSGFDDAPDGPSDTLGTFAFRSQADVSRRSADARLNLHLSPRTVLTAGGEIEEQAERSTNASRSALGSSEGSLEADRTDVGAYVQAVTRLGERLSLTGGARLDDNDAFGVHGTYRAGAAYRLPDGTRVRGSWGTAFKEPTFLENHSTGFVTGNPDLEPETSRSWEAGVEREFVAPGLTVRATYFDQAYRELIQFTAIPPSPGGPNYFNVAEASARGVELSVELRASDALTASASYGWTDSEVEDAGFQSGPDASFVEGEPLLRRPTHTAGVTLTGRLPGAGSLRVRGLWTGSRDDRDFATLPARRVELDPYLRLDLAARSGPLGIGRGAAVRPTLRVENLLDVEYQEVLNFPAPGRTILAGAEVTLGF